MEKLILAIVITIWGAGIVLRGLPADGASGSGGYGGGQIAASIFRLRDGRRRRAPHRQAPQPSLTFRPGRSAQTRRSGHCLVRGSGQAWTA